MELLISQRSAGLIFTRGITGSDMRAVLVSWWFFGVSESRTGESMVSVQFPGAHLQLDL